MAYNRAPEPTEADIQRAALANAKTVFEGSDGRLTVAYYRRLAAAGHIGIIAMNLLRALKTSSRAKQYRGRGYRSASYDTKNYSIDQLCTALDKDDCGILWGFGVDATRQWNRWVIYIDLPGFGQVSFHTDCEDRPRWRQYPGQWDGVRGVSGERIMAFCDRILAPADERVTMGTEINSPCSATCSASGS